MNTIYIKAFGLIAGLSLAGAGCASSNSTVYGDNASGSALNASGTMAASGTAMVGEPIKLGFIAPLTGDVSALGVGARSATELAVDEINAAGGVNGRKIEMVYEDGKCNPTAGTNAASKLMNIDKVVAISGGLCSSETAAFAPAAMQNKVIIISHGSSAPNLSQTGKYFFRTYPSDAYQGKFAAEYAFNTLNLKKVAIVYHISDWGTGLKDKFSERFQELGGQIVAVEGQPQESRDYRTSLTKVKAANPDMVYMPLYVDGGIVALKQYQELGIKAPVYGGDTFGDPKMVKEGSGKAPSIIYSEAVTADSADFKQKFLAKTGGAQVTLAAPQAYDNVKILAAALSQVGTDPDKLADAIRATKMQGASGDVSFDQNGDPTRADYKVMKIENGATSQVK